LRDRQVGGKQVRLAGVQMDRARADLSKVLEVVNEIGQLARFVNFITGRHYAFGQRTRTAGEDAYFRDLRRILIICGVVVGDIIDNSHRSASFGRTSRSWTCPGGRND